MKLSLFRNLHPGSIRFRAVVAMIAFWIVIVTLTAFAVFFLFTNSHERLITQKQTETVAILTSELNLRLTTLHRMLTTYQDKVPLTFASDPARAQAWLDDRGGLHTIYDNHLFFFTPQGKLLVESPFVSRKRHGMDLSWREYIKKTVETGRPYISNPYISSQDHKSPVIMFTVPIFDQNGTLTLILGGSLNLFGENGLTHVRDLPIGKQGFIEIITADHRVVVHPDPARIDKTVSLKECPFFADVQKGQFSGTRTFHRFEGGKDYLATAKWLKAVNWLILVHHSQQEMESHIFEAGKKIAGFALFLILAGSFVILWLTDSLLAPLEKFAAHIDTISRKQGNDRYFHYEKRDEIRALSSAFNRLLDELDSRYEELRKNDEVFRILALFSTDVIFWRGAGDELIYISPNCRALTGYSVEEFRADPKLLDSLVIPEDRNAWASHVHGSGESVEFRIRIKTGDIRWFRHACTAIVDENGVSQGWRGNLVDITRERMIDERLQQAQKMESIGQLAGGVAHDFNNILMAIQGYTELLKMKLTDPVLEPFLDNILNGTARAAKLVRNLLALGRKQLLRPEHCDMNRCIQDIRPLLEKTIRDDIELRLTLLDAPLPIYADRLQIDQIFINLAANARDAMPAGGILSIETDSVLIDIDFTHDHAGVAPGEYVAVFVSDNGCGMDQDTQKKIFDPFFTTKEFGTGSGLGCAITAGIVAQHRGFIHVYSEQGVGTTFKIYIPREKTDNDVKTTEAKERIEFARGKGHILLADDDAMVRDVLCSILRESGYGVTLATHGEETVRLFSENREGIDLLILDVLMPVKNGWAAYEEIKKLRPDIPVLFLSGYSRELLAEHGSLAVNAEFLSKPLSPTLLLKKIKEFLEKK